MKIGAIAITKSVWATVSRSTWLLLTLPVILSAATPVVEQPVRTDGPIYFVIYQNVRDEARFAAYIEAVMPAITSCGGELVTAEAPNFMEWCSSAWSRSRHSLSVWQCT